MSVPLLELPFQWKPREYQLDLWNHLLRGGKRADIVPGRDGRCGARCSGERERGL